MVASGAELGVSQTLGKSQTSEGVLVHPLPFSEQSVLDSAKNLIIQVSYKIVLKKNKSKTFVISCLNNFQIRCFVKFFSWPETRSLGL